MKNYRTMKQEDVEALRNLVKLLKERQVPEEQVKNLAHGCRYKERAELMGKFLQENPNANWEQTVNRVMEIIRSVPAVLV